MTLFPLKAAILLAGVSAFGAGITGTWALQSKDGEGNLVKSEITFREESGALKATLKARELRQEIDGIKRDGDRVSFVIPWQENRVNIVLNAAGDTIAGTWTVEGDSGPITGSRVAPAIGGVWRLSAERPNGSTVQVDLHLQPVASGWQGSLRSGDGTYVAIQDLAVAAEQVSFVVPMAQGNVKLTLNMQGDMLKGSWLGADSATGAVSGRR